MNDKETAIAGHMQAIIDLLGIKMDDSTRDTAGRVARMYCRELFSGMDPDNYPKITLVDNKFNYDQMIIVKDIKVHSICEHHLVPFMGTASIAYFPHKKIMGLSKFNRIVDYFSRRPQIQERLTTDIHTDLCKKLVTDDVAVMIKAEHLCVKLRGVCDQQSVTMTSMLTGRFREKPECKSEFIGLANL